MTTLTDAQVTELFGLFQWHDDPKLKGHIIQAGDWILHNLARITPPFDLRTAAGQHFSVIACHHLVQDDIIGILDELLAQRLQHLIVSFDGCWVARHQLWKPGKPLSRHSWGIALDLNCRAFPYGSKRQQDPRLVSMFLRRGWIWGGTFSTPDPMHFEVGPKWVETNCHPEGAHPPKDHGAGNQSGSGAVELSPDPITVILNGQPLPPGRLIAGSAYVPARALAEALGATVAWDPATRTVRITRP